MKKIGIGFIGFGTHALCGHFDHLGHLPVDVIAVNDPNPGVMVACDNVPYALNAVQVSEDEIYVNQNISAVFIMSPDRFHLEQTTRALRYGKHVFCEKPLIETTNDLSVLQSNIALANDCGLVFTTCHPRRFDRPFEWFRAMLPQFISELGVVLEMVFDFSYHKPSKAGLHVGLLIDHLSHEVDLMHFMFGHQGFHSYKLFDSETRYHVAGVRDDGIAFNFKGTRMLDNRTYPEFMQVRFAHGSVTMNMETGSAYLHNHECQDVRIFHGVCKTDYDGRFRKMNSDFINSMSGQPNYLTNNDLMVNAEMAVRLTEGTEWRYTVG